MKEDDLHYAMIAVDNGKLAIFGSRFGFAGLVIEDYAPFENEAQAVEEARQRMAAKGRVCDTEICRPHITRMTYSERRVRGRSSRHAT